MLKTGGLLKYGRWGEQMRINVSLCDVDGTPLSLEQLKSMLAEWDNLDQDGNTRRVAIVPSTLIPGKMVLQFYSDDPKLKENFCLY